MPPPSRSRFTFANQSSTCSTMMSRSGCNASAHSHERRWCAARRLAEHEAALRLQRRVERQRPVPHVLEAVSLRATAPQTGQRLELGAFLFRQRQRSGRKHDAYTL
jgi:hypothetical protein